MKRVRNLVLLLLILLCAISLYWGREGGLPLPAGLADWMEPHVPATLQDRLAKPAPDSYSELPPVHLAVLNGTGEAGLARRVALELAARGCVPERVDNAPHQNFPQTILVNRRLDRAEAERLAAALGGLPVLVEWDGRTTEDAVLVLGADHVTVLPQSLPRP